MKLAIIMPALNEEACIASTLNAIPAGVAAQIVVVDNGSSDCTAEMARRCGASVVSEPRRGYGRACLTGLAHLRDDIEAVAILDADGADDASNLPHMLALIKRGTADFVTTARVLGTAHRYLSLQQRLGNWLACQLMWLATGHRYRDCGPMRAIRRDALARLQMSDPTWGWNVEMQMKAVWRGLRIRELPVEYRARLAGQSKISGSLIGSLRAGARIIITIARLWSARPGCLSCATCATPSKQSY
jgi:glycosyltransferase involved in cell wall biosynthesis